MGTDEHRLEGSTGTFEAMLSAKQDAELAVFLAEIEEVHARITPYMMALVTEFRIHEPQNEEDWETCIVEVARRFADERYNLPAQCAILGVVCALNSYLVFRQA